MKIIPCGEQQNNCSPLEPSIFTGTSLRTFNPLLEPSTFQWNPFIGTFNLLLQLFAGASSGTFNPFVDTFNLLHEPSRFLGLRRGSRTLNLLLEWFTGTFVWHLHLLPEAWSGTLLLEPATCTSTTLLLDDWTL